MKDRKTTSHSFTTMFVGLLTAGAAASISGPDRGERAAHSRADDPRLAVLMSVEYSDARLVHALDYLGELLRIPITVDWPALREAGITMEMTVNLEFDDVPAETVLRLMLEAAAGAPRVAGFIVEKGGVLVTSTAKRPDVLREPRTDPQHERNVATRTILQAAHPRIMSATRTNVPLSTVLADMEKWYGIDIVIIKRALKPAPFDPETPIVEWNPESHNAEAFLRQILMQAQGVEVRQAADKAGTATNESIERLSMRIDDGIVVISAAEE